MPEILLVMAFCHIPYLPGPTRSLADATIPMRPSLLSGGVASKPRSQADSPASMATLGFRDEGAKHTLGRNRDMEWAKLKSRVALFGPTCNLPLLRSGWETEESLKFQLNRSFFVVGRVGANSESVVWQQYKFVGVTGVGMKLPIGGEIQFRGGRSLTNYDPDDLVLIPEQTKTFLEFSTRWALPGHLNLEYTGEAIPAQASFSRDIVKQDLKLARPLSKSGEIHFGAKVRWEGETTPWVDRMKIYFGLHLKR